MTAILIQGATGEWYHASDGVRQGCLLSPTIFNIFLEDIMTHAPENCKDTISIGDRNITNLRFALFAVWSVFLMLQHFTTCIDFLSFTATEQEFFLISLLQILTAHRFSVICFVHASTSGDQKTVPFMLFPKIARLIYRVTLISSRYNVSE